MKTDGPQSWIMICRGMNKYEDEFPTDNGKSVDYEEMFTGTVRPVATKQKGQSNPPLPSFSKMFVPIGLWRWRDTPAVDYFDKRSLSFRFLKRLTRILRHQDSHREDDGAMDWNSLLPMPCRDYENAPKWTNQE